MFKLFFGQHIKIYDSFSLFSGNTTSIVILFRKDMDLKPTFKIIVITLIFFDIFCIIFNVMLFCLPHLSTIYNQAVFPHIVPCILPLAQIALTGMLFIKIFVRNDKLHRLNS